MWISLRVGMVLCEFVGHSVTLCFFTQTAEWQFKSGHILGNIFGGKRQFPGTAHYNSG